MMFSTTVPAFANEIPQEPEPLPVNSSSVNPSLRFEQTEWIYRSWTNYQIQKRLWSYTYGVWKTDWINIGTPA